MDKKFFPLFAISLDNEGFTHSTVGGRDVEAAVNYEDYERGFMELFQGLEYVPDTYPPVYMLGSVVISYDKLGQIRVINAFTYERAETKRIDKIRQALVRPIIKFRGL